ncbi:MAG: 30S ribosomal protein S1, partial [Oscillospiraceae bacterium]
MEREKYYPEGKLYLTPQNKYFIRDLTTLSQAYTENLTLEAIAIACDLDHNLIVDLNGIRGIIPRSEGAYSIDDTEVKDIAIISKVNKPVC